MKLYRSKSYLIKEKKIKTYSQLALENGVSTSTIYRNRKKFGLPKVTLKWTKIELPLLKKEYINNPQIYKLFPNRTRASVYHKASRLKLRKAVRKSKYKVDQYFFDKWSSEMAYIFGLFCSDGYVSSNSNCIGFHINNIDINILKKIRKYLKSSHPIKKDKNGINFRIQNKLLYDTLIQLGCIPNKSKILKFPKIPKKYLSHFIRGYFDGDGSIHFNKPNTIKISFVGTNEFLEEMRSRINKVLNTKSNPIKESSSIWRIIYYGDDARKLCSWMYKNCNDLYLKRKRERFNSHIKLRVKNGQAGNLS